jgi:hypothetical protein
MGDQPSSPSFHIDHTHHCQLRFGSFLAPETGLGYNWLIFRTSTLDSRPCVCLSGALLIRESISPKRFPGPVPWWGAGPLSFGGPVSSASDRPEAEDRCRPMHCDGSGLSPPPHMSEKRPVTSESRLLKTSQTVRTKVIIGISVCQRRRDDAADLCPSPQCITAKPIPFFSRTRPPLSPCQTPAWIICGFWRP